MLDVTSPRVATPLPSSLWSGRVAIVSPHLDDAVLSLGASTRAATRRGTQVDVLTVLSGDPASTTPSDHSNLRAGFATTGEAARARRIEDERACRLVGAQALWLPFSDDANELGVSDEDVVEELRGRLAGYDAVLLPGFPLRHRDHQRVSRLTLRALEPGSIIGLYVEQPYASWRALSRATVTRRPSAGETRLEDIGLELSAPGRWLSSLCAPSDWAAKVAACGAYHSQILVLRKAPRTRILAYELLRGGERVMWCALA
jgi:LmbE family N-acetylglucosaminyl deacetylase